MRTQLRMPDATVAVGTLEEPSRNIAVTLLRRASSTGTIWLATLFLFVLSPLVAPGTLGSSAILSMLPFASILSLASLGQGLVVQQRGFDLSVPASMSLAALVVTKVANQEDTQVPLAIALALMAVAAGGVLNGVAATKLRITPIVATLGVNALMLGLVQWYSKGFPTGAAPGLNNLALDRTLGIPNTLIFTALVLLLVGLIMQRTVFGRRIVQVGTNPIALRLIGGPTQVLTIGAYAFAGVLYGLAGIALAAYTQTPGIFVGDSYLLPSVAAVVLAGNSLGGGQLKVASIGAAALFLSQLDQVTLSLGAPNSVQLLIQSVVLVVAVSGLAVTQRLRRSKAVKTPLADDASAHASPDPE